ncbi:hypothetical protein [Paraburkholderia caballeronis]|uniref:Uncharacterized protein n=1 Tax=Paraburkholderia caballeronis TaxID=416943 RepID=A0A1H7UGD8_9BURK|nr:hypothetical protein [Paraburkholderia caballeronis]PXW17528.1 hypothetical protein C7403_11866 [Paraburkholderia caballeronis]PXW95117.1 hypothetical protein C7407_11866 [Paraburkholderia caballeronis]RAJ90963.1 hypothetical protein C7409_11866 [Paraburkholderia caballeronis]TDV26729.1 hypothetical protein C7405_11936 [Paraburkholderia caballeronis]SEE19264.1 hypothetical protein SAMN05445871_4880 [Paraburkholderia caballeronis]
MPTNDELLLQSMTTLVNSHSKAVSRFGASVVVMSKFIEAVLPLLTAAQIESLLASFRARVGASMQYAEDATMPREFRETMLEQIDLLVHNMQVGHGTRDSARP